MNLYFNFVARSCDLLGEVRARRLNESNVSDDPIPDKRRTAVSGPIEIRAGD